MSVTSVFDSLTFESSSQNNAPEAFAFDIDSHFEACAEINGAFDAIDLLAQQEASMEAIYASLESTDLNSLDAAAVAAINAVVDKSLLAFQGIDAIVTMSQEAEGEEDKKETGKNSKGFNERVKAMRDRIVVLAKKIKAKIGDWYRKFRTGQEKLIAKAEEVKDAIKGEVVIAKPAKAFVVDGALVKPADIDNVAKKLQELVAKGYKGKDVDYIQMTGDTSIQLRVTKEGSFRVAFKDPKSPTELKETKLSESDALGLVESAIKALQLVNSIDHKMVTEQYSKKAMELIEAGKPIDEAQAELSLMRALTYTVPMRLASDLSTIISQIGSATSK